MHSSQQLKPTVFSITPRSNQPRRNSVGSNKLPCGSAIANMSIQDVKKIHGTPKNDRDFPKKENKNGVKIKHVSDGAGLSLSIKRW